MKKWIVFLVLIAIFPAFGKGTVGEKVTQFEFADCPQATDWYNGFTRSFFTNRINLELTIFPREYLAVADSWLNDAHWGFQSIQQYTRQALLDQQLTDEGYVHTQQHMASSHDFGWPFPHWSEVPLPTGFRGVTAGWHFYDEPSGWEICYAPARKSAPDHFGAAASGAWELQNLQSEGIFEPKQAWKLNVTGANPVLTSPKGVHLDPFNCPYIQIRWKADCPGGFMEWMREGDADWSADRRMNFSADWLTGRSESTRMFHSMIPLHEHSGWNGKITRIRFVFQGLEKSQPLLVNSIFTHWDTRHLVNNAIYIKAAFEYFRWTGDREFLGTMMPRLRSAMRFMMEEGNGLKLNHIRCTWPGHDGRPGYTVHADGTKTFHIGRGKGGNYWDLLPFGWDDMYTTTHYYAALLAMAQLEETVETGNLKLETEVFHSPGAASHLSPDALRTHAADVKRVTNEKFWNEKTGRFVGTIDADGVMRDYGFTFVNLEAIHYGIASEEHARQILEWIAGKREIDEDTSRGKDLYAYRLAPRATSRRNIDWYGHSWWGPETLPFGGQVQDGGAVLGFSFYDIMSRIKTRGADDAWARLMEIREWDEEVQAYGGYRKYYGDGKGGTTLQGGGTAGGIGIDFEFTESSMLSAVVPLGFMGLRPDGQVLHIEPNLPTVCPEMTVRNLSYQGVPLDIRVSPDRVWVTVHQRPSRAIRVRFGQMVLALDGVGEWVLQQD